MPRTNPRHPQRPTGLLVFLTGAVIIGVLALGLSVMNAVALSDQAADREAERIEADVEACERANRLRGQFVDIARAQRQLVVEILEARLDVDPVDEFADAFTIYDRQVAAIELVDCDAVTPGAPFTSLPEDP